jgi:competence protein ComEC
LIKLSLGFVLGIYIGFYNVLQLKLLILLSILLICLLIIFKWVWPLKSIFLYTSIFLFLHLGCITTFLHLPENQRQHLSHLDLSKSENSPFQAEVSEILRSNEFNHKFILDHIKIQNKAYKGKVLWQISRDTDISKLYVGQNVLLFSTLNNFQKAKNPQHFDYKGFMNNRNVYAIVYENHFETQSNNKSSLFAIGAKYRKDIIIALKEAGFEDKYLQLMQALILGQKQSIDKNTYNNFADVGVVHILAVSGLHVGIVLVILQFLLRPLLRLPKYGWPIMVILSILGLWGFAALAGFSPSVMRAATMFTFLAFGQLYRRKTSSVNMLCLSAMVLLLLWPQLLFEVGFQLSYAAVFAIIMLYPIFSKLYQPKHKFPKLFLDTVYVSTAAQIGVLPFQLYYFHQFPGLFLVGNIVVIPLLGILLSGGILCIALSLLGILVTQIVDLYTFMLEALLQFINWLSTFKNLIIQDIFFTKPMFVSILVMVFLFIIMVREFKVKQITSFLIASLVMSLVSIYEIAETDQKSEFILFHRPKATVIGLKQNTGLKIFTDNSAVSSRDYWLKNYTLLNRIKTVEIQPLANAYKIGDKDLLRIDSTGFYDSAIKADILLLSGSPDIHFKKLIEQTSTKQIIVDANNYRSYVERWHKTAKDLNIPFHYTYNSGYVSFILP